MPTEDVLGVGDGVSIDTCIYRGSYMSAHILLSLLNELGKRDKMRGLPRLA